MDACTTAPTPGDIIGEPCEDCGHTNVVHPGRHNPSLDACALCRLERSVASQSP